LLVLIIVGLGKGWQQSGASSLFIVGFVVIAKVIVAASLLLVLAIGCVDVVVIGGVCSASGLEVVPLVVIVQHAGESLHEGTIARRESAIVVVVIMVVFIAMVAASCCCGKGGECPGVHIFCTFCKCRQSAVLNRVVVGVRRRWRLLIGIVGAGRGHGCFCCDLRILLWL